MRYNIELSRLLLEQDELVAMARRRLSAHSSSLPLRKPERRDDHTEGLCPLSLDLDTTYEGLDYRIAVSADGASDSGIVILRECDFKGSKVPRDATELILGEAYVCALAIARLHGLSSVSLRTVLVNSRGGESEVRDEVVSLRKLESFLDRLMGAIAPLALAEVDRITKRLPSMKNAKFPYGKMREGQATFAHATYRAISGGTTLIAQAPTGTGKTVAALYPAIRALGDERCDKVFYLTPKSTTAVAARDTLLAMADRGVRLRAVILPAKERACMNGSLCKYGRDKCASSPCKELDKALLDLYSKELTVVELSDIRPIAKEYSVCPHELALSYSELCDVVVCDINYAFDPAVHIKRYFDEGGRYALLVDEAHNLPERAREMFSAELSTTRIISVTREDSGVGEASPLVSCARAIRESFFELLYPLVRDEIRELDGQTRGFAHTSSLPYELFGLTEELIVSAEEAIADTVRASDAGRDERLLFLREYAAELNKFYRALEFFDNSYELFVFYDNGEVRAKLFCLDAGGMLGRVSSICQSAVYFSATLVPLEYYRGVLGAERSAETLLVDSPFDSGAISVSVIDKISTRYTAREDTLMAILRTIGATLRARRGNYMIFTPSFEYLDKIYNGFVSKFPKIKAIRQTRDMTAEQKESFISEFKSHREDYLVGFSVLGGIYSEGIDLVGDSLIGAVIIGIGMPAVSVEREAMCAYYDERYEAGRSYAYFYPGIGRVLQAAGRVIRREEDRGVIVLIDDRLREPLFRESMPKLWRDLSYVENSRALVQRLESFWRTVDEEKRNLQNNQG